MKEFKFLVSERYNDYKVLDFLKEQGVSLEIINKVKFGGVFLNEEVVKNVNNRIANGDQVKMVLPSDKYNFNIEIVKKDLKVLYEDEYVLAVVKEKGVLTHSSKYNKTLSLEQLVLGRFAPAPFTFRAINRLDKDTKGIILIAKDEFSASLLGEQMKVGKINKKYLAICKGVPLKKHFIIEKPIKRESEKSIKRICASDGEYAKTECSLVKKLGGDKSLLDITLHTGRTHQIRVHLNSVGLPLYADKLYGEGVKDQTYYLEAYSLEFIHPFTNKTIKLSTK